MTKKDLQKQNYINRELSWINFNKRVLLLALEGETPLLEQAKFSAIFSNNLDEFFMVRVASLKSQVEAGISKTSEGNKSPIEQLKDIRDHLNPLLKQQQDHYKNILKKKLSNKNIFIQEYKDLTLLQQKWVNNYFKSSIFPVLTPLAVDPSHPFPFVSNLSLNLAVMICDPETNKKQFARVKVPQKTLGRFIEIPSNIDKAKKNITYTGIPIEEIVANNLDMLFPGMKVEEYSCFRVTRDADLELRDIEADDLMIAIEEGLRKRRMGGEIVRLEVSKDIPKNLLNLLLQGMSIEKNDLYYINGILALDELITLLKINAPELKDDPFTGQTHHLLKNSQESLLEDGSINKEEFKSIFSIIRNQDILLHHPYNLFSTSIEEFINQAANDKDVMGIKMTLYRVSKDSQIIKSLINAAENGKQVMALVELKARFDEDNNIQWAKQLEKSGVHVVYGIIGLKTHTKIALVIRKETSKLRSYFHIGTGNYNAKTAKNYTDLGLLSCKPELGQDLVELFNYLTGFSKQQDFRKLLVAPVSLRKGMINLIKREIQNVKNGNQGKIIAKMNSLVDPEIISLLYEASEAGVIIDLIVRGMCCLYPNRKHISENIRVISILGQFLEHSRIFWFLNNQNPEVYIGSADWMRRNLDRRVEAITPIESPELKHQLENILSIYLNNTNNSWEMQSTGEFKKHKSHSKENCAQSQLMFSNIEKLKS